MTLTEIIRQSLLDGVTISKNGTGELKIEGHQAMAAKWLPEIRKNKDALLAALSPWQDTIKNAPTVCRNCKRFEVIPIMGVHVAGCLYEIPGVEFPAGWHRQPLDLKKCIIHQPINIEVRPCL